MSPPGRSGSGPAGDNNWREQPYRPIIPSRNRGPRRHRLEAVAGLGADLSALCGHIVAFRRLLRCAWFAVGELIEGFAGELEVLVSGFVSLWEGLLGVDAQGGFETGDGLPQVGGPLARGQLQPRVA